MILSLLSISYGLFGITVEEYTSDINGNRAQFFICMTIHISSVLLTLGLF